MSDGFAIASNRRLLSSPVEMQPPEPPAGRRARMAVAFGASALAHVAVIVVAVALLRSQEIRTPPLVIPISLVSGSGGGGGGGAREVPPSPPPAAAPEPTSVPAEVPQPKPVPSPVARPKPLAKPRPAAKPAESTADTASPSIGAPAAGGTGSATTPGGGGTGTGGGTGFNAASPGYGVNPLPPYPVAARQLGLTGEVLLRVFVAANGQPTNVLVLKSSGHAMLDDSAVETVRTRWRFIPATRNGVPVDDTVQVPIRFRQTDR
ncbi:MAG TPA: TonB family protein [Candidatus Eisenbacteria bacterium]|nr:TonB family protein [Candidatus Eisenbacteria bacterium]